MKFYEVPLIIGRTVDEQLTQVNEYLQKLVTDLNYNLENTTVEKFWQKTADALSSSGGKDESKPKSEIQQRDALKALIIKSATSVLKQEDEFSKTLEGMYLAESDFGTYTETATLTVNGNPYNISQLFRYQTEVITDVKNYKTDLEGFINTGILDTSSADTVFGMEIGYNRDSFTKVVDGVETTVKLSSKAKIRVEPEKIGFWVNGEEKAWLGVDAVYFPVSEATVKSIDIGGGTFKVDRNGNMTATSGKVGGWDILSRAIRQTSGEYEVRLSNYETAGGGSRFLHCIYHYTENGTEKEVDTISFKRNGEAVFRSTDNTCGINIFNGTVGFYYGSTHYGSITTTVSETQRYWTLFANTNIDAFSIGYDMSGGGDVTREYFMYRDKQDYSFDGTNYGYYHRFKGNTWVDGNLFLSGGMGINASFKVIGKTTLYGGLTVNGEADFKDNVIFEGLSTQVNGELKLGTEADVSIFRSSSGGLVINGGNTPIYLKGSELYFNGRKVLLTYAT